MTLAWPPRALEAYPLTLLMKNKRDPQSQPGSPGGTSPGGTLVSPASSASEHVFLEPITTPEDEKVIAAMVFALPELFMRSLAGSYREKYDPLLARLGRDPS